VCSGRIRSSERTGNLSTGNQAITVDPAGVPWPRRLEPAWGTAYRRQAPWAQGCLGSRQTRISPLLLQFLESKEHPGLVEPAGCVLNNQKAVLKVGTDQFFVTNVTELP